MAGTLDYTTIGENKKRKRALGFNAAPSLLNPNAAAPGVLDSIGIMARRGLSPSALAATPLAPIVPAASNNNMPLGQRFGETLNRQVGAQVGPVVDVAAGAARNLGDSAGIIGRSAMTGAGAVGGTLADVGRGYFGTGNAAPAAVPAATTARPSEAPTTTARPAEAPGVRVMTPAANAALHSNAGYGPGTDSSVLGAPPAMGQATTTPSAPAAAGGGIIKVV
ncbi:MAG: hypothetical protein Q8P46_00515, partial [Hyphomicrobiales bacterium]|nr:hypothetical protein [Hyphomicrobiales bacterium]